MAKRKAGRRHSDFFDSLRDASLFLATVAAPLIGVWFEYPVKLPLLDVLALEKLVISLAWIIFIGHFYYRKKIDRLLR